ncbi:hypothetical protein CYMTET_3707 [Cymbomonas tetramitiformis]|uniref:Kinesin light chain n=1 Tax=Cymbomonas tetramitiformis TaxID=36881 RepID=A0AAE0LKS7_9CHLO|nr:hypothetical protein CYMTET_3707 [Cymbomonas tetramitiformis]|eukprot:gene1864-2533_t
MASQEAEHKDCWKPAPDALVPQENEGEEFPTLGIPLAELRDFIQQYQQCVQYTTAEVCEKIVKLATAEIKCSYVELLRDKGRRLGPATVFVSHAWRYLFSEFTETVLALEHTEEQPEDIFLWIDVFCVNQHKTAERDFAWWSTTFREAVRDIGHTLVVLLPFSHPVPLARAWCLFEIFSTVDTSARLDLRIGTSEEKKFITELSEGRFDFDSWAAAVNLEDAEAWDPHDRMQIMDAVHASVGFVGLNTCVMEAMRDWLVVQGRQALWAMSEPNRSSSELVVNLSRLLHKQGKNAEAEPLCRAALEARRANLGAEHPDTLRCHNLLAKLMSLQRSTEAEALYREVVECRRKILGADHMETLDSISGLAQVLSFSGRDSEAEPLLREVLNGKRDQLGADSVHTLASGNNLANLLLKKGHFESAEPLFREVLAGRRAKLGARHPETLASMNNLANLLKDQKVTHNEAESLFREALDGRRAKLGVRHSLTLATMANLANLLTAQGKLQEAELLYSEALQGRLGALGESHPQTLASMNDFARFLLKRGKLGEAERLYRKALEGAGIRFGANHPSTLDAVVAHAKVLQQCGELDQAELLFRKALKGWSDMFGAGHSKTRAATNSLTALKGRRSKLLRERDSAVVSKVCSAKAESDTNLDSAVGSKECSAKVESSA